MGISAACDFFREPLLFTFDTDFGVRATSAGEEEEKPSHLDHQVWRVGRGCRWLHVPSIRRKLIARIGFSEQNKSQWILVA